MHVPERLLARMSAGRLLQHAGVDAPPGSRNGGLTLKTFAIVTDVVYDREKQRATGVRVLDAVSSRTTEYPCARGFSVRVGPELHLASMRSATDVWPGDWEAAPASSGTT